MTGVYVELKKHSSKRARDFSPGEWFVFEDTQVLCLRTDVGYYSVTGRFFADDLDAPARGVAGLRIVEDDGA